MSEEIKRGRGRPKKNTTVETNTVQSSPTLETNEYNSYVSNYVSESIFKCGVFEYFTKEQIDCILKDPIGNHELAIELANFIYNKNGIVSNAIDYMCSLMCLDRVITNKSKKPNSKTKANKEMMRSTLHTINDKSFIRDALHTEMNNGICFYYFETTQKTSDNNKYMQDFEVENIMEINELGINATIVTLPYQYTKIVGKKNGRYVLAFNLNYFNDYTGEALNKKLRKYPKEIRDAHANKGSNGNWVVLDNDKTICKKIKCKDTEPWGRPLAIAALDDILYKDSFVDTKRKVLDEINNKVIYETFPEGKDKGSCALTKKQQEEQHNAVKQAVTNKNSRGGISFFSVAAGTKLDTINVSTDIFDEKNESDLNNQISLDLGICSTLLGATSTGGNYSVQQSNLEMITAQLYTWVYELQCELNHVINKNIIKDEKNRVEIYYFPTSFVNRNTFFEMMKSLYTEASGSLTFLIASAGVDVDAYYSVMDEEIENGIYEKYKPHLTSYTISGNSNDGGRPENDNPTNENTIQSKGANSNNQPKPSTK